MPGYEILRPVDATTVPDWERRPAKWAELTDAVLKLEPGKALPVKFQSIEEAERARNAVRDAVNMRAEAVVVRTRMEKQEDDTAIIWLTRLYAESFDGKK